MKRTLEPTMNEARFRALVEAFGADRARWPSDERSAAEAFLAGSLEATRWLEDEARLDALLDAAPEVEASASLERRIAEIPIRNEAVHRAGLELATWWPVLRLRNFLIAGFAAATLGIVAGIAQPDGELSIDSGSNWDALSDVALAGEIAEELAP